LRHSNSANEWHQWRSNCSNGNANGAIGASHSIANGANDASLGQCGGQDRHSKGTSPMATNGALGDVVFEKLS
jgi:hypothetical protein